MSQSTGSRNLLFELGRSTYCYRVGGTGSTYETRQIRRAFANFFLNRGARPGKCRYESKNAFCLVARNSRLTTCCGTSLVRYARAFVDTHLAVMTIRWREKRAIAPMANHCPNAVPIPFARMTSACANRGTVARPLKDRRAASTLTNVPLRSATIVPPIQYAKTPPVHSIANAPMDSLAIPPRPRVVSISTNVP